MGMNGHNGTPVVRMENIVKRFGTITALDGVDFSVEKQQVMALVGDNGAGKSTLIKMVSIPSPAGRFTSKATRCRSIPRVMRVI